MKQLTPEEQRIRDYCEKEMFLEVVEFIDSSPEILKEYCEWKYVNPLPTDIFHKAFTKCGTIVFDTGQIFCTCCKPIKRVKE